MAQRSLTTDVDRRWKGNRRLAHMAFKACYEDNTVVEQLRRLATTKMSEEELSKEEKLEAARKKFEELKKKTKKGKKKGKKAAKEGESDEKADDATTEADGEGANNEDTDFVPESSVEPETAQAVEDVEEPKDTEVNVDNETEAEPVTTQLEDDTPSASDETAKVIEDDDHKSATVEESLEAEVSQADVPTEEPMPATQTNEPVKGETEVEGEVDAEAEVNDIFANNNPNGESTFMSDTLNATIKELRLENEAFKKEISELKAENLELKLTKMDTEMEFDEAKNEIETQKKQIERLTQQLHAAQSNNANQHDDGMSIISGTDYLNQATSSFQNLASFNMNDGSQDYMDIVDVKERLQQWKGWNMDMHGWRSIGMGPVVEF